MKSVFDLLGIALACYVAWAVGRGRIASRSGLRMRWILRGEAPRQFWFVAGCYLLLALALIFAF